MFRDFVIIHWLLSVVLLFSEFQNRVELEYTERSVKQPVDSLVNDKMVSRRLSIEVKIYTRLRVNGITT